jgi:membrane protease YdiL (CAAX protease family)
MKTELEKRTIRNVLIFWVGMIALPWLGVALDLGKGGDPHDQQNSLGWLLFLVSPLLMTLLLRLFGKDGWRDFGLAPRLRQSAGWYLFALLFHPLTMSLFILAGVAFGVTSLPGLKAGWLGVFGQALLVAIGLNFGKNIFEEFAWRGYLTPKINAIARQPLIGHAMVGLIWFSWHLVYYTRLLPTESLQKATGLTLLPFLGLTLLGIFPTAILYGELRLLSGTVWTAVLIHTLANAFFDTLIAQQIFSTPNPTASLLISPGLFSLVTLLVNLAVGLWLHRQRLAREASLGGSHA